MSSNSEEVPKIKIYGPTKKVQYINIEDSSDLKPIGDVQTGEIELPVYKSSIKQETVLTTTKPANSDIEESKKGKKKKLTSKMF